jgi:hypothetical protein
VLALALGLSTNAQRDPAPGIVTGTSFRLVDPSGVVRGNWLVNDENFTTLLLKDPTGKLGIAIGCSKEGSSIGLLEAGIPRVMFMLTDVGPSLVFYPDSSVGPVVEDPRIYLGVNDEDRWSRLRLYTPGNGGASVGALPDGSAFLSLNAPEFNGLVGKTTNPRFGVVLSPRTDIGSHNWG